MGRVNLHKGIVFSIVCIISVISLILVPIIAMVYSYDTLTLLEASVGFVILLITASGLGFFHKRVRHSGNSAAFEKDTLIGITLGGLWLIEIGINNFIAPPLPLRDHIDNLFWALIALTIFLLSILRAYQAKSILRGITTGAWSGFVSGLLACWAGLSLIVFAMGFVVRDPLNIAEWAARGTSTHAPSMAAYFAFETFAGAFLHLVILGVVMGGLLGIIGGLLGKGLRRIKTFQKI